MDEVLLRRLVGVITLAIAAFLLSWLLPRPGLERLRGEGERVVTVDLTRPDAQPQEILEPPEDVKPAEKTAPSRQPAENPLPTPPVPAQTQEASPAAPAAKSSEPAPKAPTAAASLPSTEPPTVVMEAPKPPAPPKPIESKPVEPKPAVPTPAKPPAASDPPSGGGAGQAMVQAGAFSFLDKAEAVRERAGALGQRCVISPAETPKGTLYRLRCGPYADRAQAQAAANKLSASGIAAQVVGGGR